MDSTFFRFLLVGGILLFTTPCPAKGFGYDYTLKLRSEAEPELVKLFHEIYDSIGNRQACVEIVSSWPRSSDEIAIKDIVQACAYRNVSWECARKIVEIMQVPDEKKVEQLISVFHEIPEPSRRVEIMAFLRKWMHDYLEIIELYASALDDNRVYTPAGNPEGSASKVSDQALSSILDWLQSEGALSADQADSYRDSDLRDSREAIFELLDEHGITDVASLPNIRKPNAKSKNDSDDSDPHGRQEQTNESRSVTRADSGTRWKLISLFGVLLLGFISIVLYRIIKKGHRRGSGAPPRISR